MVKHSAQRLDSVFKALSDSTRRAMLLRLAQGELSVSELAAPFDMSLAAVSKHLKVLEAAEFVEKTRYGRIFRCRARLEPLSGVTELLDDLGAFWRTRLDALETLLSDENTDAGLKHGTKSRKK